MNRGVAPGPYSVEALLETLYKKNPEAVVNGEAILAIRHNDEQSPTDTYRSIR